MRRLSRSWAFGMSSALVVCLSATVAAAQTEPTYEVRALVALQTQLALGHQSALGAQRALIRDIGAQFASMPAETWSKRANARAAIRYLLSGGDPAFARDRKIRAAMPEPFRPLLDAALAYSNGDAAEARRKFASIKANEFAPELFGSLALVKGLLDAAKNPDKAWSYLDAARLEGAGTLVEEAALRRQIGMISARAHAKQSRSVARSYIRSYQASVFSEGFRRGLALTVAASVKSGDQKLAGWLVPTLKLVSPARRATYIAPIARQALLYGQTDVVQKMGTLLEAGSGERYAGVTTPMILYEAASQITGDRYDDVKKRLGTIDPSSFDTFDRAIFRGVVALARQVRAQPYDDMPEAPPTGRASRNFPGNSTLQAGADILKRSSAVLADAKP